MKGRAVRGTAQVQNTAKKRRKRSALGNRPCLRIQARLKYEKQTMSEKETMSERFKTRDVDVTVYIWLPRHATAGRRDQKH